MASILIRSSEKEEVLVEFSELPFQIMGLVCWRIWSRVVCHWMVCTRRMMNAAGGVSCSVSACGRCAVSTSGMKQG